VKKTNKAIDKGDYDAVVKALNEGGDDIAKAVDS
jgi:ribosomal protein S20